ncbi:gamma-glutamylcyclotransferase [Mangrovicoccus algicola]|uniref:glutathione-specific gamma-glutamylcyclotransferase n=1 Tax=Mangrovicoccus algicola TaxID=2771008 RepID=A0A8J7CYI7_9RHOB|nr:gamma-glutamylcyclotransferase [Mangrovicoccus algicola]MBE3636583.1 gamma-glutamylcyclotransferase [Mangrovicoccus algicola]
MTSPDLWVFGYGSLLWSPCFDPAERQLARLEGWHRSFCMWSVHYRGTPERPGLVLALDAAEGGACLGVAFRVAAPAREAALAALRERELVSSAYREEWLPVLLPDGRRVEAVTYVVDPAHPQYAGGLSLEEQAAVIGAAAGRKGPNRDYLDNTHRHLLELGLEDADMAWLAGALARA